MAVREYIGARYVPIFGRVDETSIEWDNSKPYEPLTIVIYQGNSYTSRQYVPVGIPITNEEFWALTGNYNAQVEQYRQEVRSFDGRITANSDAIADFNEELGSFETETRDAIAAERTAREAADNAEAQARTDAIAAEAQAREAADSAEAQAREAADTALEESIAAEREAREAADNEIKELLDTVEIPDSLLAAIATTRFEVPMFGTTRGALQGGCHADGYDVVAIADGQNGRDGLIQVWQGQTLIRSQTYPIYHGNSIDYENGFIYVTCMDNAQVLKIPFSQGVLGAYQTIDFSRFVSGLTGCVFMGGFYYIFHDSNVYKITENLSTSEIVFTFRDEDRAGINQAMSKWGSHGLIFTRSTPGTAIFVDLEKSDVVKKMFINEFYDLCYYDEVEQVQVDDENNIYVYAASNFAGGSTARVKVGTVFKSNLVRQLGSGRRNMLMDAATIFVQVDYGNDSYKVPKINPGTTGISDSNPIFVKWTQDIDAIVKSIGNYDVRLKFLSDYPHTYAIENYSVHVNGNSKVIDSIMMRGGHAFFTGLTNSYPAADNTNQKEHGGTTFFNLYNSIAVINNDVPTDYVNNILTVNSCIVGIRSRMMAKTANTNSVFLKDWTLI